MYVLFYACNADLVVVGARAIVRCVSVCVAVLFTEKEDLFFFPTEKCDPSGNNIGYDYGEESADYGINSNYSHSPGTDKRRVEFEIRACVRYAIIPYIYHVSVLQTVIFRPVNGVYASTHVVCACYPRVFSRGAR